MVHPSSRAKSNDFRAVAGYINAQRSAHDLPTAQLAPAGVFPWAPHRLHRASLDRLAHLCNVAQQLLCNCMSIQGRPRSDSGHSIWLGRIPMTFRAAPLKDC